MNEPLLHIQHLVKKYTTPAETVDVLNGLDLEVTEGDLIAVIGHSGSGKSTLLHLVGGLDSFQDGKIHYRGEEIQDFNNLKLADYRKNSIGFVFQFHYLLMEYTVWENIRIPALIRHQGDTAKIDEKIAELLHFLGIEDKMNRYPTEISGGEKQRVAIARALINSPCLLLADEPTGNLDEENRNKVIQLMLDINKKYRQTIIMATHDLEIAQKMSKIYRLQHGILEKV